jgi:hypothetical protein
MCSPSFTALLALMATLAPVASRADGGATPEQIRAVRANLVKSPPKPGDYAAQPYPGAVLDPDCSAFATASRQPEVTVYCYYTRDPTDKVRAFVKGAGKPRHSVTATVEKANVAVDGRVTIPEVTRITYWVNHKTRAFHESFPAAPPSDVELIAAPYPGAAYDVACSADRTMEAQGKPRWRKVYCFTANHPYATVQQAFDLEVRSTPKRGVQVDLTEVSRDPPVTRIEYWIAAASPQSAAPTSPAEGRTTPQASGPQPSGASGTAAPSTTTAPSPAPAPPPNPASQAADTINKMRGLFGR